MSKKIFLVAIFSIISSSVVFPSQVGADEAVTQNIIQSGRFAGLSEQEAISILDQESKDKRDAEKTTSNAASTASNQQSLQVGRAFFPPFGVDVHQD